MARMDYLAEFVRDIYRNLAADAVCETGPGLLFMRKGVGMLVLSRDDIPAYADVVERLHKGYGTKGDVSVKTLKTYVQDVLFEALGAPGTLRDDAAFEGRLATALKSLGKKLHEPAAEYAVYLPVSGLSTEGLPWTFGRVRLAPVSRSGLRRIVFAPDAKYSSRQSADRRSILRDLRNDESLALPLARVKVMAKDADAAMDLAMRRTREIVDVLNCLAPLVPNNYGRVYLAGEAERTTSSALVMRGGHLVRTSSAVKGPLDLLSCETLKSAPGLRPALRRVHELLRNRSELGELLTTSMTWAGRASLEPVREHAFLQYAIALETLMVPEDAQGIKYRLTARVIRFLGRSAGDRDWLHDTVPALYGLRSDIVHDGFLEVSPDDLGKLSWIARQCIFRALVHRSIRRMTTVSEFTRWLDTR